MNISEPFIRRPVMTSLVMLSILVFGIISYFALPVSDLPNVDYPSIQVQVEYPGASPETMATTCAVPLEREFMTIEGLNTIVSKSSTGLLQLQLQFVLDKSLDGAATDVQSAINRAEPYLPKNLPYNPFYKKTNSSQTPILYLAITSEDFTVGQLYDYGQTFMGQRINMIDGVSEVQVYGSPYAARIQVNPEELAGMQIGIDQVSDAIRQGNVNLPTGTLYGKKDEFTIDADGQLMEGKGYDALAIKAEDGSLVKIQQIGRGLDSLKDDKYYAELITDKGREKTLVLAIQRQPGTNTVQIIESIDALLPLLKKQLPASIKIHKIFDDKEIIEAGVSEVKATLLIAFILVVLVIYLSLGKALNTIIPSITLPLSIIGTFAIMFLLNFNIDILSLLALTLSIGFLVDDAIVVLENNYRHVEEGLTPFEASIKGSKEIGQTILSMTLCLASVFIPMLFLGDVVGRLFREFSLTIIIAVIFSGLISLTLTPLLCSRFIPKKKEKKISKMEQFSELIFSKLLKIYEKSLTFVLHKRKTILTLGLISLLGSFYLFITLPKDFLPNEDEGFIMGYTEAADGTSPFLMKTYQQQLATIAEKDPNVDLVVSVSSINTMADNQGVMFIRLKPRNERISVFKVIDELMVKMNQKPGINCFLSVIPLINLQPGMQTKALYQYTLSSVDQDKLIQAALAMEGKIQKTTGFTQVSSDLEISQPQLRLSIDRDRASDLNITAFDIETMLTYAYAGGKISTIDGASNQYDVIIETLPSYYRDPSVLSKLYIRSKTNNLVPLEEIIKDSKDVGPLAVNHLNGIPSATLSFNLAIPLGEAVSQLESIADTTLPTDVYGALEGTADVFKRSFANLTFLLILTFFVIYVILGILYENFIHPITVMSTLPPASFGGLLSLYLFGQTLSLYSFVGLILLLGIVMKNGIMMVDFANQYAINEKKEALDAIYKACMVRFRPILMTTIAALMGALPIAIGLGGASATRRPMGIVIVGGLLFSQILTLYLTPIIYYYLQRIQEGKKRVMDEGETSQMNP